MRYLLWSNEYGFWYRHDGGFTWIIDLAARYPEDHARQVAGNDLFRGQMYPPYPNVVLVPAPEDIQGGHLDPYPAALVRI